MASAGAFAPAPRAHAQRHRVRRINEFPFTLGVASGDPLPGSVVLWTRLAPRPYEAGGGLPPAGSVDVQWDIARDEQFHHIERSGLTPATADLGYSVHVDVQGLEPDRTYWYRFRTGTWSSPTGRTRTAPAPQAPVSQMRLGLASCQQYDGGYYTAHAHLAREDLHAVFFVGDYIYENAIDPQAGARRLPAGHQLPGVFGHKPTTLADYRLRYALAKSDADLQSAHAAHPWCVTWDDHEVVNNYAADIPPAGEPTGPFLQRRAAAYRAYWENMPLRPAQYPQGAHMLLYRRLRFGRLAQFDVLDTRQYRSDQAYGDGWQHPGPDSENASRTITGHAQERWLLDGFGASPATWNVIPQQVAFCRRRLTTTKPSPLSMDAWDGYPASRNRVLDAVQAAGINNLIVLSGDSHIHLAMDIKKNFDDPRSATLGVEILGTSISSGGDGMNRPEDRTEILAANPHMSYYAKQRGYVVITLTPTHARADYRTLPHVTRPGAPLTTGASLVTEAGHPGFRPA
ncbi:alkaline phosphatase D family protein [Streptomyces sp. NPDC053079]|uniref:alkaline phosphatase D family protein n=1 Tax=Streptomyces sp. NPDC053079 TaxID=3365697 RepID=UPI0037D6184A